MKKIPLLVFLVFGLYVSGFSQSRSIKGRVTDDHGKPLAGASINIKNTPTSALTDSSGNFEIAVTGKTKEDLVVSFVGYLNAELAIGKGSYFEVQLKSTAQTLNDVIVVGYGTQKKRDVTGAISTVRPDENAHRPLVKVEQALQGTAPGVAVQSSNGMPGNPLSVRIRGTNSITGSNEPLYVIDGYIGGSIGSINPSDIESLEILKDASASAIYGSRASNGVVIITTRAGHDGAPRINLGAWFQKQEVAKDLDRRKETDLLNGKPLIELPERHLSIVPCEFDEDEREFYFALENKIDEAMQKFVKNDEVMKNYTNVMVLLLRLRQGISASMIMRTTLSRADVSLACTHPSLVSKDYNTDREAIESRPAPKEGDKDEELTTMFKELGVSKGKKCQLCQDEYIPRFLVVAQLADT